MQSCNQQVIGVFSRRIAGARCMQSDASNAAARAVARLAFAGAVATLFWSSIRQIRQLRPLTVVQYNVLFDSHKDGCIDATVRSYAKAEELAWSARCANIARRVRECADVALFEELGPAMFETLRPMLPEFDAWHASELVTAVKHPDGEELAIFIRRSTVIIDGVPRCRRLVAYAQTEEERQVMMVAEQPGDSPPEVYAVISAAVRRHGWLASKTLIVGGTHLRWEFGEMPAAKAKPVQAICAGRAMWEHARDASACGVALAADFNSFPVHGAVLAVGDAGLSAGHPEHPGGGCGDLRLYPPLRSAFADVHGADPPFTRKKNTIDSQFCLDYVFIGGDEVRATGAGFGAGPPPYKLDGDGSDLPYLPCDAWPSDHLPIAVQLMTCVQP